MTADIRIERFVRQARGAGVDDGLLRDLRAEAPPSAVLAPRLQQVLPRAGAQGRLAVADLAVSLADDVGYRPVVEAVVRRYPLDPAYVGSFLWKGCHLDGEALRWWLDLVDTDPTTTAQVDHALYERREALLERDRDLVVAHLVRTDHGPAHYAADLAAVVLRRGGPCAPLEELFSRWIRDGRFDATLDAADGSTSSQILAMSLERCITHGPFTIRWALVEETLDHWCELLESPDPEQRRRGLTCLVMLLWFKTSFAGMLPFGVAGAVPTDTAEWAAIERGFSMIELQKRAHTRNSSSDREIDLARRALQKLADGPEPLAPPDPAAVAPAPSRWRLRDRLRRRR